MTVAARPTADPTPTPAHAKPRRRDWDETPAEAARYDRAYFDDLYDRDEDR